MHSYQNPTRRLAIGAISSCLAGATVMRLMAAEPWKEADLVTATDLAASLRGNGAHPLILHVGFPVLYRGAHIPGSIYAGAGSKPADIELLKKALAGIPHDREILIYCGCCPWQNCPNIRPAFTNIQSLGYSRIKVLMIPTNLHTDWVEKGFPVEKG